MSNPNSFSARNGIAEAPAPKPDEAPEPLRYWVFQYVKNEHGETPADAAEFIATALGAPRLSAGYAGPDTQMAWRRLHLSLREMEWWKIYDMLEYFYRAMRYGRKQYTAMLNDELRTEANCYRMDEHGKIVYAASEALESAMHNAEIALGLKGKAAARNEIHAALEMLAHRPAADLAGAAQRAMAGLDLAVKSAADGPTLDTFLQRRAGEFPPQLGQALKLLGEFAANKGKQLAENPQPRHEDVELLVNIAAAVATYVNR